MLNRQTTVLDIIEATAQQLDTPTSVVWAVGLQGINNALDNYGWADGALLLYSIEQGGTLTIEPSGYARASEQVVLAFALDCKRDEHDAQDKLEQMKGLAMQFFQQLIRQDAFRDVPSNEGFPTINYQKEVFEYNGQYALVTTTFTLNYDPNVPVPKC